MEVSMSFPGRIMNGMVVFDAPLPLPDGTKVNVAVTEPSGNLPGKQGQPMSHFERYKDIIEAAVGLPEDFAENHDHYIHGTPKR